MKNRQKANDNLTNSEEANIINDKISEFLCVIPNKNWLTTYESFNGGVFLGNGYIFKAAGKGTLQIKMHNGVTRTLSGVKHILEEDFDFLRFSRKEQLQV